MWTPKNRPRYDRDKLRYPSDLTNEEWSLIEPLIPPAKHGGRKREVVVREVVNGVMYLLSTGDRSGVQTGLKEISPTRLVGLITKPRFVVYEQRLALLSNSGPGVLANFGPPPVPQPTVTLMDRGAFCGLESQSGFVRAAPS